MIRKKLSINEQINHMKYEKGIKFNIVNEIEAKKFLEDNTYYFKIKSYAKNYDKYMNGHNKNKYVNLEFAYLKELSTIDMHFRGFVLRMTLNIEHYLKTKLIKDCANNDNEDGYNIVQELFLAKPYILDKINQSKFRKNSASYDLINKYHDNFAIWNIVEVLDFGSFINLYKLYYTKYETEGSMHDYLWSVNFLRNAAAHNNCLLNSLKTPYSKTITPNQKITYFLSQIDGISREARREKMQNPIIHDFVVSLIVFSQVVTSDGVKRNTLNDLKTLLNNRMTDNKEYFENNQLILSYYFFIKIIVDYLYSI